MYKNRFYPSLYRLTLLFGILLQFTALPVAAIPCDVDDNGDINLTDIELIEQSINASPSGLGDPRDATRDGQITIEDVRLCFLQCALPLCTEFAGDTDNDGDGFSVSEGDCHDGDAGINPDADDILSNGIDENCDGIGHNARPIAYAGPDQSALIGELITLDGGGSVDQDGDFLTFAWSLTTPIDSMAELSDPTAINPKFTIDIEGTYIADLVVNDGFLNSTLDSVTITTGNSAPVADAGPDQTRMVGDRVILDGSGSNDVDDDLLTFAWFFTPPSSSGAMLDDSTLMNPMFTIDLPGDYIAELIVNDGEEDSDPDTVTIRSGNTLPVADAGPDQSTPLVGATVSLDGSGSTDVDGDSLTFNWSFISRPVGSTATLSDASAVMPTFVIDLAGDFVVQLIVNDGLLMSVADTVMVNTPGISVFSSTVGSGLQLGSFAFLGASQHGGVMVHIEISNNGVALVSPDSTTSGTASIDVEVANGSNAAGFFIQGREGQTGVVTITASASGFTDGNGIATIVQSALQLFDLRTNLNTLDPDDPFQVAIGIPNSSNTGVTNFLEVRAGGSAVTATIANSDDNVGRLVTSTTSGGSVTVEFAPGGQRFSPVSVATGGVAFEPLTAGTTTVSATIPGFISTTQATQDVTVISP